MVTHYTVVWWSNKNQFQLVYTHFVENTFKLNAGIFKTLRFIL